MTNPYITCPTPEVWRSLLKNPEKHWRDGYSAKELAMSWLHADGLSPKVESVLRRSPHFHDIEMLLGVPEHRVSLPGRGFASQNDLWVLAQAGGRFVSIAVEGKGEESFDKTVGELLADATVNRRTRHAELAKILGLDGAIPNEIRYQLVHRTASAIIEAQRFNAAHAIMLVHSFSETHAHFGDFERFVGLYDCAASRDIVISVGEWSGVQLHFAWVTGEKVDRDRE